MGKNKTPACSIANDLEMGSIEFVLNTFDTRTHEDMTLIYNSGAQAPENMEDDLSNLVVTPILHGADFGRRNFSDTLLDLLHAIRIGAHTPAIPIHEAIGTVDSKAHKTFVRALRSMENVSVDVSSEVADGVFVKIVGVCGCTPKKPHSISLRWFVAYTDTGWSLCVSTVTSITAIDPAPQVKEEKPSPEWTSQSRRKVSEYVVGAPFVAQVPDSLDLDALFVKYPPHFKVDPQEIYFILGQFAFHQRQWIALTSSFLQPKMHNYSNVLAWMQKAKIIYTNGRFGAGEARQFCLDYKYQGVATRPEVITLPALRRKLKGKSDVMVKGETIVGAENIDVVTLENSAPAAQEELIAEEIGQQEIVAESVAA